MLSADSEGGAAHQANRREQQSDICREWRQLREGFEPGSARPVWKQVNSPHQHFVYFLQKCVGEQSNACSFDSLKILFFRRFLDLSRNLLANIEDDAFSQLLSLSELDLSENHLEEVALKLPNSLEHLRMIMNKLKFWPFVNRPTNLTAVEVQQNNLVEMFSRFASSKTIEFENLSKLNVSHNRIEAISALFRFPNLRQLDLSYNRFQQIPPNLNSQAPDLDWLRLNGNPISEIKLANKLHVRKLELSELALVTELDASELNSIGEKSDFRRFVSLNTGDFFKSPKPGQIVWSSRSRAVRS